MSTKTEEQNDSVQNAHSFSKEIQQTKVSLPE